MSVCALSLSMASAFADTIHVEGTAAFQLRHTIVPLIIVNGGPVPQSQSYWVVLVKGSDGNSYELDEQFDLDQNSKPSEIEFEGVTLKENFGIILDGTVTYQSGNYIWLSNISNLERFNIDYQVILPPLPTDPFMNWTCQGQMDADNDVYADVWFQADPDPTSSSPGSYVVRLSTAPVLGDNRQFSELAYLDGGHLNVNTEQMTFDVTSAQDSISLEIVNSNALEQVPGMMSFSVHESARDLGVSSVKSVNNLNVSCNRNR
jgi:hypothetical protein